MRCLRRWLGAVLGLWLLAGGATTAYGSGLDFLPWQELPSFYRGRVAPLDTFARGTVNTVYGTDRPRLRLYEPLPGEGELEERLAAEAIFGDRGEVQRFTAAETVFSWLVETDRWEHVPFLQASHDGLRREILDLPLRDAQGRLTHVSPWQLDSYRGGAALMELDNYLMRRSQAQQQAEAAGREFQSEPLDKPARELAEAYRLFRMVTFDPREGAGRGRIRNEVMELVHLWHESGTSLGQMREMMLVGDDDPLGDAEAAMQAIAAAAMEDRFSLDALEPPVLAFHGAVQASAAQLSHYHEQLFQNPPEWQEDQLARVRTTIRRLMLACGEMARQAHLAHESLYDAGYSLRIAPALNPYALEMDRRAEDLSQPWLAVQKLRFGSDAALAEYPAQPLRRVRAAFDTAAAAYTDRQRSDRAAEFAAALTDLSAAIRAFGEEVNPLRRALPLENADDEILALTAYPPAGSTRLEVHYNTLDPFFWSWIAFLVALVFVAASFGSFARLTFWTATGVAVIAQALLVYGLTLRTVITGWAPVTNMFETIVFVALIVAFVGFWFCLLPLFWPALRYAWRLTGLQGPPTEPKESRSEDGYLPPGVELAFRWSLVALRGLLAAVVIWALSLRPYYEAGQPLIALLPTIPAGTGTLLPSIDLATAWMDSLAQWLSRIGVLLGMAWLAPRAILSLAACAVVVPVSWAQRDVRTALGDVFDRRGLLGLGAAVGCFSLGLAYFAPIFDSAISPLMPVLRDRFWLFVHVAIITASYGAAALAWGLSCVAMGYYLFGRYRKGPKERGVAVEGGALATTRETSRSTAAEVQRLARSEPAACGPLTAQSYKAIQVAVVLLAAGTILGGLWADVSWGRFWGWDPKEVWALVSLMVFLGILHGRYIGWFGNFGLCVGYVLGATSIVMAWYGVNYLLGSGLHAYGGGAGGGWYVLSFLVANWLFVMAAGARYATELLFDEPPPDAESAAASAENEGTVEHALVE